MSWRHYCHKRDFFETWKKEVLCKRRFRKSLAAAKINYGFYSHHRLFRNPLAWSIDSVGLHFLLGADCLSSQVTLSSGVIQSYLRLAELTNIWSFEPLAVIVLVLKIVGAFPFGADIARVEAFELWAMVELVSLEIEWVKIVMEQ